MLIYPAIDIREGKCVRLRQGRFDDQTIFSDSPADVARHYADKGFSRLHIVDLDGAVSGIPVNARVIREIASVPGLTIQVGGGVRSLHTVDTLLEWGVDTVIVGSVALERPGDVIAWAAERGEDRFALAVDIIDGQLAAHGWKDQNRADALEFIQGFAEKGFKRFICTDISRDGMMLGPAFSLYEGLRGLFPSLDIVASGGVSSLADIRKLRTIGMYGAIVGRGLLDGTIDLVQLRNWERKHAD